jgi:hypothetical protein
LGVKVRHMLKNGVSDSHSRVAAPMRNQQYSMIETNRSWVVALEAIEQVNHSCSTCYLKLSFYFQSSRPLRIRSRTD